MYTCLSKYYCILKLKLCTYAFRKIAKQISSNKGHLVLHPLTICMFHYGRN